MRKVRTRTAASIDPTKRPHEQNHRHPGRPIYLEPRNGSKRRRADSSSKLRVSVLPASTLFLLRGCRFKAPQRIQRSSMRSPPPSTLPTPALRTQCPPPLPQNPLL